jgi:(heptosyl)LPS beta-1,4-glucosyltransferase
MRLGGFVIHGNSVDTLGACLDSLGAVCDEVVAVSSGALDGSRQLSERRGAKVVDLCWQGYGAAREAAVKALKGCDYVFYLDSDERLAPEGVAALKRWRLQKDPRPSERVWLRDWVELGGRCFEFRRSTKARLMAYELAQWKPQMIVHESLGLPKTPPLDVWVEHRFVSSNTHRAEKDERYAWLWALKAFAEGRRGHAFGRRAAHALKSLLVEGALWRGGVKALQVAWEAARYHQRKYQWLRQFELGWFDEALEAYRLGDFKAVFRFSSRVLLP